MTSPITPDLADLFPGQTVIVTPIDPLTPPPNGAVVLWKPGACEGVVIQPLHTAQDRKALAARIERIRKEQTERKP